MRWFKGRPGGGANLSGRIAPAPVPGAMAPGIDAIRNRMLAIARAADARRFPNVEHRIRYAPDIEALWFLRGDLMALLATTHGELAARESVMAVTELFGELVPEGLRPRPCRLDSRSGH